MSQIKLNPFFNFCRVKVTQQSFDQEKKMVTMTIHPDERYDPICHRCQQKVKRIHSYKGKTVRDLNCFDTQTFLWVRYRIVKCPRCGNRVEELDFVDPRKRVTKRLAQYILSLCPYLTIKEIARHLGLDWKTVKAIHKEYLRVKFSKSLDENPCLLAVDEVAVKKRHHYLTIVLNWETGQVLHVGEGRRYETLKVYFDSLREEQKGSIEAIAIDTWDPYIKAVKECCSNALIVFDQFHMVKAFGRIIDQVRRLEYWKATQYGKAVIMVSKYLLLKNKDHLLPEEKPRLQRLLELNQNLSLVYILKDFLKKLWDEVNPAQVQKTLEAWCQLAFESHLKPVMTFAKMLKYYAYGILNHCQYPLHTSRLEGINNKINVIKRKAYGFHDLEYFSLIIKDSFARSN
jgi:transposase